MNIFQKLLNQFHRDKNPYTGFPCDHWKGVWYNDPGAKRPIYEKCIDLVKPGLVIEVGSFVGESAVHMADVLKRKGKDAAILCVDTWYAGFDHYLGAPEKIVDHFGRSDLFYRFMANVIERRSQDVIVPFAMDSTNAARVLKWKGILADLIYVDASHEEGDVLRDYDAYWELVRSGGLMLCDDWSGCFPQVIRDGNRFIEKHGVQPILIEGEKVLFQKP